MSNPSPRRGHGHTHDPGSASPSVALEHPGQPDRRYVYAGEPLTIRVGVARHRARARSGARVSRSATATGEVLYAADTDMIGMALPPIDGPARSPSPSVACRSLDGAFPISIQLKDRHDGRLLDFREGQDVFEVVNPSKAGGSVLFPVSVEMVRPADSTIV